MKSLIALVTLMTSVAHAGDFVCVGTGRFAAIEKRPLSLTQDAKDDRKKLLDASSGEVQVSLEKADDAGGPYLMIDVVDDTDYTSGDMAYHGAKGVMTGPVMYIDSPDSLITCAPVKTTPPATAADKDTTLR